MIVYHPRSDIYHCMFRLINIIDLMKLDEFEHTRLRIYDMLYLFPHFIKDIELPRTKGMALIKKSAKSISEPYENLPDKKRLFSELGDFQIQAIQVLIAKDIVAEENGMLRKARNFDSDHIKKLIEAHNSKDHSLLIKVIDTLNKVDLPGNTGLKKRTGLMEYRYDAI